MRAMEVSITPPLGDDLLLFYALHAREELGRLGDYQLDLLSAKKDIKVDDVLGKNVTVKVALPDDSERFFNGFVTRFAQGGSLGRYTRYHATVRSWLWFLTRTTDCRIFQEMTVPDIVKKVFADHSTADYKFELTGSYRKWTYCVQYRETDFNFVTRLLEHEGIYFYTQHTDGHNTLVLTDSTSKSVPVPGYEKISFIAPEDVVRPELEHVESWDFASDIQPGVYVHDDYDLERPSVELRTRKTLPRTYSPSDYEIYDYPGHYIQKGDGEQYAHVRIDEFGTLFETAEGAGNSKGISVGSLFTLEDYPREDQNREYLVVGASYSMRFGDYEALPQSSGGTEYRVSFVAMPSSQQFRPRRLTPKPFVQGPQTAVVVGPAGDEIYVDKYGRIKVQFHWDRYGKKDDKSSCWIRVSQPWAGQSWGAITNPRIGQEVIVDFLEGDPDQPIITGRVYNAEQMPPYALPGNKTQSGIVSRSSPGGSADNFNELMFEDKKGSELIYMRAEKDYTNAVENDEVRWVGHDRWTEVDNDETNHIKHDRTETVDNDETITIHGNRTETVDKNETITIHQNRTETVDKNETITISGNRTISVSKNESATVALTRTHTVGINEAITVGAAQEITVGAAQTITVGAVQAITVGANQSMTVGGGQDMSVGGSRAIKAGGSQNVTIGANLATSVAKDEERKVTGERKVEIGKDDSLKVKKNIDIDAGEAILIKTGDASISMKKDGTIVIKGKDITIDGSGKINIKAGGDIVMKGSKIKQN
jgi:type VI secretion system secreted protein VgrG